MRASAAGVRPAPGKSTGVPAAVGVDTHGVEHGAPQTLPMPEQPSAAIATGAEMSDRSTIRTSTPRMSESLSQGRIDAASQRIQMIAASSNPLPLSISRSASSRPLDPKLRARIAAPRFHALGTVALAESRSAEAVRDPRSALCRALPVVGKRELRRTRAGSLWPS
jgi:hypothetical protein